MTGSLALLAALGIFQEASAVSTARNLGIAHYERGDYVLAVEAFEEVLESDEATARDVFNAGMAALQNREAERALAHLTTARQMDRSLVEVEFGLGVLFKRQLLYPRALEAFERVVARDPEDVCTWLHVGVVRQAMGRVEAAERAFDRVVAIGHARGKNFYLSALFRKASLLARRGERERAQALFEQFEALRATTPGVALTPEALENGPYGRVRPPLASASSAPEPRRLAPVALTELGALEAPRCEGDSPSLVLGDHDRDGLVDLFVASPCGGSRLYRNEGRARFEDVSAESGLDGVDTASGAVFFDDEASDRLSLYVWSPAGARLFRSRGDRYVDETTPSEIPPQAGPAIPLDVDSDGQLDLFLFGSAVLRNDGDGTFTKAAFGDGRQAREVVAADFDADGDVDVLLGLEKEVLLLQNDSGRLTAGTPIAFRGRHLAVLDVDHDGWLDVAGWGDGEPVALENAEGAVRPSEAPDSSADAWGVPLGGAVLVNASLVEGSVANGLLEPSVAADLEGDGSTTLLFSAGDGTIRRFREARPAAGWLGVALEGRRSNRAAVGAEVEVKVGRFYRKQMYRGLPLTFDTGGRDRVDVVRVTWTNGVVQNVIDVPTEAALTIEEDDRQTSSCPFLYVWDGERFRFLTDIVGRAPLGEITPDGGVVTPNPEDDVRIPPGAMTSLEGRYVLQITEELREAAYLDAFSLLVVDHPEDVELYTNERFSAPPFEPFALRFVRDRLPPLSARDGDGTDVLERVRSLDGRYTDVSRHPVPGFAREHVLELVAPRLGEGEPTVLLLSGFVNWPSSSSMRALSANQDFVPRPPLLQAEAEGGSWRTIVEDLGLPSGIDRTLVVPVSPGHRRLRVVTNFAVHWDRAAFARPLDLSIRERRLPLVSANLHYRGFSHVTREEGRPERYDYERLLSVPPWEGAPGRYTRFGDVTELVGLADKRLAVMAPGDEMTVVFDGRDLAPVEKGQTRTFVLRVRGWAKDRDPNTLSSGSVEPLPTGEDDSTRTRAPAPLFPRLAPP